MKAFKRCALESRSSVAVLPVTCVFAFAMSACSKAPPKSEVVFDPDYRSTYVRYLRKEYPDRKQVRIYYVNRKGLSGDAAASGFPMGSKFVLEVYNAEVDNTGKLMRNGEGAMMVADLSVISVMHKDKNFGTRYAPAIRNGDWAYAFYRPDGIEITSEAAVQDCLTCHRANAAGQDYVVSKPDLTPYFPRP